MPNHKYHILSTRLIPDELLQTAGEQGIDITTKEFINIQPIISDTLKERIHTLLHEKVQVIFTSANAANAVSRYNMSRPGKFYNREVGDPVDWDSIKKQQGFDKPGWNIYCLEGATLEAVERLEYENLLHNNEVIATAANAAALAEQIVQQGNVSSVVFFCGNKRRNELPDILRGHGIAVEEIIVYETTETPVVAGENYDGIFFFSPSAVKSFFAQNRLGKQTVCFTIGYTTAKELQDFTDNRIIVSTDPRMEELVQTAIFYFNNINCYE